MIYLKCVSLRFCKERFGWSRRKWMKRNVQNSPYWANIFCFSRQISNVSFSRVEKSQVEATNPVFWRLMLTRAFFMCFYEWLFKQLWAWMEMSFPANWAASFGVTWKRFCCLTAKKWIRVWTVCSSSFTTGNENDGTEATYCSFWLCEQVLIVDCFLAWFKAEWRFCQWFCILLVLNSTPFSYMSMSMNLSRGVLGF